MRIKIRELFFAVAGMIFILSAAVSFTVAFKPLYYMDIRFLDLQKETGYDREVLVRNYNELIDYNLFPFHKELQFPDFPMSEEARIHFQEVKAIFQAFIYACLVSGVLFLPFMIYRIRKRNAGFLKVTGTLTIGLPIVLGGFCLSNWEKAFILFHELVFDNDYWLFDPYTDPIIDCLPDEFFLHCALLIIILILSASIFCILTGSRLSGITSDQ